MEVNNEFTPVANCSTAPEFLDAMKNYRGRFRQLLENSPKIKEQMTSSTKDGQKFREALFLRLHTEVLMHPETATRETFGLYEQADFEGFLEALGKTRQDNKQLEADWFRKLSNTLRQSVDLNYNARQPGGTIEGFKRMLKLYLHDYNLWAGKNPPITAALEAYKKALEDIRQANEGVIPPSFIEYGKTGTSTWDQAAETYLRDNLKIQSNDSSGLEVKMNLAIAKAHGFATGQFLEHMDERGGLITRLINALKTKVKIVNTRRWHQLNQSIIPTAQPGTP